jgi:hypothetical protein
LQKAVKSHAEADPRGREDDAPKARAVEKKDSRKQAQEEVAEESDSDDSIGPTLPGQEGARGRGGRMGPSIPNMQDLELKRGKFDSFHLYWL